MLQIELSDIYKPRMVILWSALAFEAGIMNATGFLMAGSFVSHITGFGTQIGLALGQDEIRFGVELLIIPVSFVLGAFVVSLILDGDHAKKLPVRFVWVQILNSLTLLAIILLFSFHAFDTTPPFLNDEKSIPLVGLLCFSCGLKNGMTTWASHGKIRVTHLTGLATDLGLNLRRLVKRWNWQGRYPEPARTNLVRLSIFFSFSAGSGIAAYFIPILEERIFFLIFILSFVLTCVSLFQDPKPHRKTHT